MARPIASFGATGLKPEELLEAEHVQANVAKEILLVWDKQNAEDELDKYFSGGWKGTSHPRKMGYYFGLKVFKRIEKELGTEAAVRIKPADFRTRAKTVLLEIAGLK